jgi:hypothetical protein
MAPMGEAERILVRAAENNVATFGIQEAGCLPAYTIIASLVTHGLMGTVLLGARRNLGADP